MCILWVTLFYFFTSLSTRTCVLTGIGEFSKRWTGERVRGSNTCLYGSRGPGGIRGRPASCSVGMCLLSLLAWLALRTECWVRTLITWRTDAVNQSVVLLHCAFLRHNNEIACLRISVFLYVIARQRESYLWIQPEHSYLHLRAWEKWTWAAVREHISTFHVFIFCAAPLLRCITLPLRTNPKIIITSKMWFKTTLSFSNDIYIVGPNI